MAPKSLAFTASSNWTAKIAQFMPVASSLGMVEGSESLKEVAAAVDILL
jgi:hypothetical protein